MLACICVGRHVLRQHDVGQRPTLILYRGIYVVGEGVVVSHFATLTEWPASVGFLRVWSVLVCWYICGLDVTISSVCMCMCVRCTLFICRDLTESCLESSRAVDESHEGSCCFLGCEQEGDGGSLTT